MSSFTHRKLLLTSNQPKGRAYNFARAQRERKKRKQRRSQFIGVQPTAKAGVLIPLCSSGQTLWSPRKFPLLLNLTLFRIIRPQVLQPVTSVSQGPAHPPKLLPRPGHLWCSGTVSMAAECLLSTPSLSPCQTDTETSQTMVWFWG